MPRKSVNTIFILRHACSKGVLRTQTFNNRFFRLVPIAIGSVRQFLSQPSQNLS